MDMLKTMGSQDSSELRGFQNLVLLDDSSLFSPEDHDKTSAEIDLRGKYFSS